MTAILVVEDDPELREALRATLAVAGFVAEAAPDGEAALRSIEERPVSLVISDVQMQPINGMTLLGQIRRRAPGLPVVLMTAYGEIEQAVAAMRAGATDYLAKPFDAAALIALARRHLAAAPQAEEAGVVAEDERSRRLLELARRVARSAATVLITGESGCGKEVIARYVHRHSPRAPGPFVAINCAAIPENLLEATLFGYEKGAFTGAAQSQPGKFEQAQDGTLLLDEVSEMPLPLQAKLLRVLQEREVERVGGRKSIALDIRVIATSNRDLPAEVAKGRFREDLYYRLNVFPLTVPPLRERPADVPALAHHLLARAAARSGRPGATLASCAVKELVRHTWPGNVRELENVLQRALILAPGALIEPDHLHLAGQPAFAAAEDAAHRPADIKSLEREHILKTLAAVGGSRKLAVQRLGISERTLRHKLQRYRLAGATS